MARIVAVETGSQTTLWRVSDGVAAPVDSGQPDLTISDAHPPQGFPTALAGRGPLTQDTPPDRLPALARLMTLGAVAGDPNWDGIVLCVLPDSAQWTHVSASEAISTLGTVTPRLAGMLAASGLLDQTAMEATLSRPERLATALYSAPDDALSHLIGADMAAAKRWWLGQQVRIVGSGALAQAYADALITQGAPIIQTDPTTAIARGLVALVAV